MIRTANLFKIATFAVALCLGTLARQANASIVFSFTEVGGDVVMTPSGILDTTKLIVTGLPDGWTGTGTEHNGTPGDIDIMGGTSFGGVNVNFGFSAGTDASAITNPGGPFAFSQFNAVAITGSKSFTTYGGFLGGLRTAGIGVVTSDIAGGFWTPDQGWTYSGTNFAALGLITGTYAVSDSVTGESITIQIGPAAEIPEPSGVVLLGLGGIGLMAARRRRPSA
jgi:hypothetical protein